MNWEPLMITLVAPHKSAQSETIQDESEVTEVTPPEDDNQPEES